METRVLENGVVRYSFPCGHQGANEVVRVFRKSLPKAEILNISIFSKDRYLQGAPHKWARRSSLIISCRKGKIYYLHVPNCHYETGHERPPIRGITSLNGVNYLCNLISRALHRQTSSSDDNMRRNISFSRLKKLIRDFYRENLDWYPKSLCRRMNLFDVVISGLGPLSASSYKYRKEGLRHDPVIDNLIRHSRGLRDLAQKIFGMRSSWAVQKTKEYIHELGNPSVPLLLRGLVSTDRLKRICDSGDTMHTDGYTFHRRYVRSFLKMFQPETIERWFTEKYASGCSGSMYLYDAARMWDQLPPEHRVLPRTRDLVEIHNELSIAQRRMIQSDFKLNFQKPVLKLDGEEVEDMVLRVPKTNYELIEWGQRMSNCIASYSRRTSKLVGVERKGELTYCVEIHDGRVNQFLGKYNQDPNASDRTAIVKFLQDEKVISRQY
jgi:hypothetical protein